MALPNKSIVYAFAPPVSPDALILPGWQKPQLFTVLPAGGKAVSLHKKASALKFSATDRANAQSTQGRSLDSSPFQTITPSVIFTDLICTITTHSYQIDVFLSTAASLVADPTANSDYVGRITHLAMGPGSQAQSAAGLDNAGRRNKLTVNQSLPASYGIHCIPENGELEVKQVVPNLGTGQIREENVWRT